LASLGTFHQLWVTKDEYEEHGMQIIHQRKSCITDLVPEETVVYSRRR
jgi:hypothetical protein